MDLFFKEFKQPTLIYKYAREKDSKDEFYYPLTVKTVYNWVDDNLSQKALTLLLLFTTAIKEDYPWDVKLTKFRCPAFQYESDLEEAYEELLAKGYAVKDGDKVYLRNDKRVDFPKGLTEKTAQSSSFGNNAPMPPKQQEESRNELKYRQKMAQLLNCGLTQREAEVEVERLERAGML